MSAHTPGPWKCHVWSAAASELDSPRQAPFILTTPTATNIAQDEVNARLIAAAPDLLAALRFIDREMGNASSRGASARPTAKALNAMWDAARAAIAKAKGETP